MMTVSASEAVASAEMAAFAPQSTSAETASSRVSNTVNGYPAFKRWVAIGLPILPRPIKPIGSFMAPLS